MDDIRVGFLLKRNFIKYKLKKYEYFEFLDVAFAYQQNDNFLVLNGKYVGVEADDVAKVDDCDCDYVFVRKKYEEIMKRSANSKFDEVCKKFVNYFKCVKYYIRKNITELIPLSSNNEPLYDYIVKNTEKKVDEFDESELNNSSDISFMYSSIKNTIISQDEQIMQILTALFKNQKVVNSDMDLDLIAKLKENVIVYGSTGTGKTEILKRISKLYNIPIVIEDVTSLSETGYEGRDVSDMLEDLCSAADGDIELAQKGILVIDEFDKLAENSYNGQNHVSREGVQRSLLKLLDGTTFYLKNKKFDTSKLTVVALGAFTGIVEGDDYKKLTSDDFMRYGIMRELMGRFSKTIAMNPLSKDDIIKILKNSDFSPLNTYKKLFEMLDVDFKYDEEFIDYIADLAVEKKSGARSLKTVFDECISSALFRIFAGEYSSISLVKPTNDNPIPYVLAKNNVSKNNKK